MRSIQQRFTATGAGRWVGMDRTQAPFQTSLFIIPGASVTFTCKVQLSSDDPANNRRFFSASRAATVATVTDVQHNLSVGDSITVTGAGAPFDGTYDVATVTGTDTFTYTVANSGATVSGAGAIMSHYRVFDHPTLFDIFQRASGNIVVPVTALRLNISALSGGNGIIDFNILQGAER